VPSLSPRLLYRPTPMHSALASINVIKQYGSRVDDCKSSWYVYSGVPKFLEWEGSRCRWRRGSGAWGGDTPFPLPPPHWGKALGRGLTENFSYFLLKIPYFNAF